MSSRPFPDRGAVRVAEVALATASALALANLPGDVLPPEWLAAFALPGAVLGRYGRWFGQGIVRALVALAMQAAACWAALATIGPLTQPAALACTILPPLGFAAARNQPVDRPLALFLGFCVLLIGTILDGVHLPLLLAWVAATTVAMRAAERLAVRENHGAPAQAHGPRAPCMRPELALVLGALCATVVVEQALAWLPSPGRGFSGSANARGGAGGAGSSERAIGLDDSFDLGAAGAGGRELAPADGTVLARARGFAGDSVPGNLYLRSAHFARAGLGQWQTGPLAPRRVVGDVATLGERRSGERSRRWDLERTAAARDLVFVPPHTVVVAGCTGLAVDPDRAWVRQPDGKSPLRYHVTTRVLGPLSADARPEPFDEALLEVPPELDRGRWNELLDAWQVPRTPLAAMERIEAGLQQHCRYDRREPSGPFANALENFLFATTDRHGYCMHFASAAAMLLRLRGIPCRIAVGVHGGEPEPTEPGTRRYTSEHAHAWVEVPFAGRGFEVFDPTPAAERGHRAPAATLGAASAPEPRPEPAAPLPATTTEPATLPALWPWIAATTAIGIVLLSLRVRPGSGSPAGPGNDATPIRQARKLLAVLQHELAAAGHARAPGAPLEAYARELATRSWLPPEVEAAFAAWQQVRFGELPFDEHREQLLQQGIAKARAMRARTSGVPSR